MNKKIISTTNSMYHITSPAKLDWILNGEKYWEIDSDGQVIYKRKNPGLMPGHPLINALGGPINAFKKAIWGFIDPLQWAENKRYSWVMDFLLSGIVDEHLNAVKLKVDLEKEDEPLILERHHIIQEQDNRKKPTTEAWHAYWNSRVPYNDYEGTYTFPEVVLFKPIPIEQIFIQEEFNALEFLKKYEAG
jgi:hypothetical protein